MYIESDLYREIQRVIPIPCVDLIIVNSQGEVLLAKRTNEPAQGEWWFPGGRVHYLETRFDAAKRKLKEECGFEAGQLDELGTFDVVVERLDNGSKSHAITTAFVVRVFSETTITLDDQNSDAEWCMPGDWLNMWLNPFVRQVLEIFTRYNR